MKAFTKANFLRFINSESASGAQAFNAGEAPPNLLAKDRWDSNSVEAKFHKSIRFLTRRNQGYVMGAFRDVILSMQGD